MDYNVKAKEGKSETWFNLDELTKLPNGRWDCNDFVGKKIYFKRKHKMNKYDWLCGELEIIKVKKKNNNWLINIKYLNIEYDDFQLNNILNGCIGKIVDVRNEFRFSDCGTYKIGECADGVEFYYDTEDADKVEKSVWYPIYRKVDVVHCIYSSNCNGKTTTLHKQIMNKSYMYHKNNVCDNRKSNLKCKETTNSNTKKRKLVSKCANTFIKDNGFVWCIIYGKDKNEKCRTKIDYEFMKFMKLYGLTCNVGNKDRIIIRGCMDGVEINQVVNRFIYGLKKGEYKNWEVDHINQDCLDNRKCNLVITDKNGNMCNTPGKCYMQTNSGAWRVRYMSNKLGEKNFKTEEEAIREVEFRRSSYMSKRLEFYSKEELDKYIKSN